jgi:hypothetical protein
MKSASFRLQPQRIFMALSLGFALASAAHQAGAGERWQEALAQMPLPSNVSPLNRSNCVHVVLKAFRSNDVVRALVFLPGATDEFYMFRRAEARLTNSSPSLLDAIIALTNQTLIRATFRPPFLLLHTDEDPLEPAIDVQDARTARTLMESRHLAQLASDDRDWNAVQPILKKSLKVDIRPWHGSDGSWHFYRHSFAAWGLNGMQALEVTSLAGKTQVTLRKKSAVFKPDPRVRATPKFDVFPR